MKIYNKSEELTSLLKAQLIAHFGQIDWVSPEHVQELHEKKLLCFLPDDAVVVMEKITIVFDYGDDSEIEQVAAVYRPTP